MGGPLVKGLSQKLGTGPAPMNPALLSMPVSWSGWSGDCFAWESAINIPEPSDTSRPIIEMGASEDPVLPPPTDAADVRLA